MTPDTGRSEWECSCRLQPGIRGLLPHMPYRSDHEEWIQVHPASPLHGFHHALLGRLRWYQQRLSRQANDTNDTNDRIGTWIGLGRSVGSGL